MQNAIPPQYNHREVENEIYKKWEESGVFSPKVKNEKHTPRRNKVFGAGLKVKSFSIVMPPPNVTGTLHLGHAMMLALEDIMARYHRMRGDKTLWLPGTDHASIATQSVVEKKLKKEKGLRRQDLGREKFLQEVEKFVNASKDRMHLQIRKMGASCDWSREAYTLDEARSLSARVAFKTLYDKGLIYRGDRIVNWCPRCQSTLSDDEVEYRPTKAMFYTFKYDKNFPIAIATTRPETKLGDTAVAVNPKDRRYQKHIGKTFRVNFCHLPLEIKIIADKGVDANFGTGALGVTPAHSQIDFALAEKNNLPIKKVIDEQGRMINAGSFNGLIVKEAREEIIKQLSQDGLLEKIEEIDQNLSLCYRCETPIEPLTSLQWFINVNKPFAFKQSKQAPIKGMKDGQKITLKFLMRHAVESGQIKIIPEYFTKTYFQWIDNLRDWCISRQIWFGHRIPVWYRGKEVYVGSEPPKGNDWKQDEDTLDTWFSSGLWTFSALGWPQKVKSEKLKVKSYEEMNDFERFHPTSVLETGYDILFFWVARMILMTGAIIGEIPFKTVYLHGLVRDMRGKKMSKSLGNVIDPLDMIEKYGADAVRLSLFIGTSAGTDVKLNEQKIAGYRNFANKIWNAARFVMMNLDEEFLSTYTSPTGQTSRAGVRTAEDKKILKELESVVKKVTRYLDDFDFNHAGDLAYHYFWHTFCDKIIEQMKPRLKDEKEKEAAQYLLYATLAACLKLLHPFMPFVTEAVWQRLPKEKESMLIIESWPKLQD